MLELNFCPFCDAPQHKLLACSNDVFFCKDCNKFFKFSELILKCIKCDSTNIMKSDFPAPNGEAVFQCKDCKKSFSATQFFNYNKIK